MLSETMEVKRPAAWSGEESDRFYAELADGLHALAQPLTILRGSIMAMSSEEIMPERQQHYLDVSKSQLERACALFDAVQALVIEAQSRAERSAFDPDVQRELP
jgi:signal transduction histidine kinase